MATEIKQKFHEVRLSMVTSEYDQVDTDSQIDLESLSAEQNTNKFSKLSPSSDLCWFHYPSQPWSVSYYFNEGQENFHIYLWLLKDLAWVQSWYLPGIFIGGFACFWSIFLVSKSISHRNVNEFWSRFADLLWLFANYWWMLGETHDYEKPNEPSQYEAKTRQAAAIMITALVWIGSYYLVLKPFGVVDKFTNTPTPSAPVTDSLVEEHPRPRFAFYFNSWREYENLHSLFWIGKDTAWVLAKTPMWFLFFFPTLSVSIDVTVTTLFKPNLLIDHAHHCAQLLWVLANAVWATGELFLTTHHDEPLSLARYLPHFPLRPYSLSQVRFRSTSDSKMVVFLGGLILLSSPASPPSHLDTSHLHRQGQTSRHRSESPGKQSPIPSVRWNQSGGEHGKKQ
jgi:hypothetical protein